MKGKKGRARAVLFLGCSLAKMRINININNTIAMIHHIIATGRF